MVTTDVSEKSSLFRRELIIKKIQDLRIQGRDIENFYLLTEIKKEIKENIDLLYIIDTESKKHPFSKHNFEQI